MSYLLLFKRTVKKPALLVMMCAILVCTLLCGMLTKDDGIPACGVVSGSDANAIAITERLVSDGLIRYNSKEELLRGIQKGEISSGMVFPDNLTDLLEETETDEMILFYKSPDVLFPSLYMYRTVAYLMDIYAPYLTSTLLSYHDVERSPERMKVIIDEYLANDTPFEFRVENAEGAPLEADHYSYNLAVGVLALFLFFAFGLFAVPYTEKQFLPIAKRIGLEKALLNFALPSVLCTALLFFMSAAAALVLSDVIFDSGTISLIGPAAVYIIFLSALGIAVTAVFSSTEKVRIPIMAMCLMAIAFCPIFVDIPALLGLPSWPRFILPPSFFYAAKASLIPCAIVAVLAFAAAAVLYTYAYKRKLYLK